MTTLNGRQAGRRFSGALLATLAFATITVGCGSGVSEKRLAQGENPNAAPAAPAPGPAATSPASPESSPLATESSPLATEAAPSVESTPGAANGQPGAQATATTGGKRPASQAVPGSPAPRAGTAPTQAAAASGKSPNQPSSPSGASGVPGSAVAPVPAPGAPSGAPADPIKFGSVGTNSGPVGQAVIGNVQGAKAWVADVNGRGGLNGHPVQVIFADDGGDPSRALSLTKKLVEDDKVVALMPVYAPFTGQAISPYLEQKHVPAIETCSCSETTDTSPMMFPVAHGSTLANVWSQVMPLLAGSDKRNVAMFYCREVKICTDLSNGISGKAGELGIKIVYKAQVSLAQPDYTAEVLAARNAGAEAILILAENASAIRVVRSARRQSYNPLFVSQFNPHDETFLKNGGKEVEGFLLEARTAPWSTSPLLADLRAALPKYVPGALFSDHTAVAWTAGKMLEKISVRFTARAVTTNDILEGLYSLKGETLGGLLPPTAYKRDQVHIDSNNCGIPMTVKGGKFVPIKDESFWCAPWWKPVGS